MRYHVYILRCSDGSYYTGHTENLESRLAAHQSGHFGGYTHTRLPVTLVFTQKFPTRVEALASERRIKGWSRAKKEALIAGDWEALAHWSNQHPSPAVPSPSLQSNATPSRVKRADELVQNVTA